MSAQIEIGVKLKNIGRRLDLSRSKIDDSHSKEIANKLISCDTIESVDISSNIRMNDLLFR